MPTSRMLSRVALVRIDFSETCIASIIRVKIIYELRTTLSAPSNLRSVLQLLVTANVIICDITSLKIALFIVYCILCSQ
jgi:hypothetical protein